MSREVAFTQELFNSLYAPAEWKVQHNQWNFAAEISGINNWIASTNNPSVKDFQRQLKAVVLSAKDYHTSTAFAWTEKASLPFQIKSAEGHYYIVYIDRTQLPATTFPLNVGDEVLQFDNQTIASIVAYFVTVLGGNTPTTDNALAELMVTRRSASRGDVVPQGNVVITAIPQGATQPVKVTTTWAYVPETITPDINPRDLEFQVSSLGSQIGQTLHDRINKQMVAPMAVDMVDNSADDNGFTIGGAKTFLPQLGTVLWQAPEGPPYIDGYIYQQPSGKKIGYIRLPSYETPNNELITSVFVDMITKMQAETDALVIDEMNNPGGSVFYVYALASHLSAQPMLLPPHRVKLTQGIVVDATTNIAALKDIKTDADATTAIGNTADGYVVTAVLAKKMLNYYQTVVAQWQAGKTLTDPIALYLDQTEPQTASAYTKPILLLVNELDFSGGDFFPAILQDNKRVTIMGVRTAGAGGFIQEVDFPNQMGISYISLTGSIAVRQNQNPIENLGVTPDVVYPIKASDIRNGFKGYADAVNAAVGSLK